MDVSKVPDFVSVANGGGVVGYVARADVFPNLKPGEPVPSSEQTSAPQTVYAADLVTVVGHLYPGQGFVALGVDPATLPTLPTFTSEHAASAPTFRPDS